MCYLRLHSESAQSFLSDSLGICLPASETGSKSHTERISQSLQGMSVLYVNAPDDPTVELLCFLFPVVCLPSHRRRCSGGSPPFLLPLPLTSCMNTHRAPFRPLKQVNRKGVGEEKERGQIRQTPACVLTFPSPSISHPVAPLLRQQCWTC